MNSETLKKMSPVPHATYPSTQKIAIPSASKSPNVSAPVCTSREHNEKHRQLIAECAYFIAENRHFSGGDPKQDWLDAEKRICQFPH